MANANFQLKRAATKTQGFSMTKDNTPPEAKVNHKLALKPRQSNQTPNSTKDVDSPEVENTMFHQLSLGTPQDKHRPLKQQSKSKRI
jgi:hypothetical protein